MKIGRMYIVLFILLISTFLSADEKVVIRFDTPEQEIVNEFNSTEYDVAAYKPGEFLDIVVTRQKYTELLNSGYDVYITQTENSMRQNLQAPADLDGYRNYSDLLTELQQIETDYPDLCKLYDIGNSRGKNYSDDGNSNYDDYYHEIWALKVSDNVLNDEDEPHVYYVAEHHAREPISLEVSMAILNHILDNYGTDPQITDNIDNTQVWFVPLLNPDGHKIVTEEIELMWRKNLCDNNENGQIDVSGYYSADGVDPNRNYGWEWGGAGTSWYSETYQGTSAFSEPETHAFKQLLDSHHFVAGISYHSYGELVLFPFGYSDGVISPDHAAQEELAVAMANTIPGQYSGYYNPQEAWALYPCTGTTDDYAYGEHGIFAHTIELATEFIPPASQVNGICDDNIQAGLLLLNRPHHQVLTGHISDANTNEPLVGEIFVDGVDNTGEYRKPYQSNMDFGSYYRLLTEGTFDVTFSAYGYDSQTFSDVQITSDDKTILDVALQPASSTIDLSGTVYNGDTSEPLANATVAIQGFDIPEVTTNMNGEYTIPDIYEYTYNIAVYANNFAGFVDSYNVNANNDEIDFDLYALDDGTFESGEFNNSWQFDGNADWIIDSGYSNNGTYSARSGNIYDEQTSALSVSMYVTADGEISFARKVSSEEDYDYLRFYIDDELIDMWSGNEDWNSVVYPVEEGFHTFTWEYFKDQAVTNGQDCGWIDDVVFPTASLIIDPMLLEFLTYENCVDGLNFTILNQTANAITINDIAQTGTEFDWYIDDFNLSLPYSLESNEELEFNVKVNLPVDHTSRDIISDVLAIETAIGTYEIDLFFDDSLLTGTNDNNVPGITEFFGNYPNPFNPETTFKYSLAQTADVSLEIYNIKGQKVRTLVSKQQEAGFHSIVWNGKDDENKAVSSGIYFSRFAEKDNTQSRYTSVKKVIILK